jgi:hypothetical protein
MQGGKNWILAKEIMQTGSSETFIGWKPGKTTCPSLGPNGGSVAMESVHVVPSLFQGGGGVAGRELM